MTKVPIKVEYLMDHYAHPYGGTERQVLELIRRLDRTRFEPRVTVFRASHYLNEHAFDCEVTILGINKIASLRSFKRLNRHARELAKSGYRVAHIVFNDASVMAPALLKWHGVQVVVSRRDMGFWYSRQNMRWLRANRRFVDHVVANSDAVKRKVCESEGYASERVSVIRNGYYLNAGDDRDAGTATRARYGLPKDARIVGMVANLRPIKRIGDLINAFVRVLQTCPDAWLVIVGAGHEQDALELLAKTCGVSRRVVFTGQLQEPATVIREFSVGVLCSESEGLSNAIIEYMLAGKPTVCTDVGGNPELIIDGETGFLVPVGTIETLAERISRLLRDHDLARCIGASAQDQAREKYRMSNMVDAHMELYERVLAGPGRSDTRGSEDSLSLQSKSCIRADQ